MSEFPKKETMNPNPRTMEKIIYLAKLV